MKHSYYENLVFDQKVLTKSEQEALQTHLAKCVKCQDIFNSWKSIYPLLCKPEMKVPRLGFSTRWASSLQYRTEKEKRKVLKSIIVSLAGTALLCLLVFILVNLNAGNASVYFQRAASFFQNTEVIQNQVTNFIYIALNKMPSFFWIIILISFLGWVSIGGLFWYFVKKNKKKNKVGYETQK